MLVGYRQPGPRCNSTKQKLSMPLSLVSPSCSDRRNFSASEAVAQRDFPLREREHGHQPWPEMDIADLTHSLDYGDTFAQTASFLCSDEDEVRPKAKELGLVEQHIRVVL
jgi:hypothetical protein